MRFEANVYEMYFGFTAKFVILCQNNREKKLRWRIFVYVCMNALYDFFNTVDNRSEENYNLNSFFFSLPIHDALAIKKRYSFKIFFLYQSASNYSDNKLWLLIFFFQNNNA